MNPVTRISPVSDADVPRLAGSETLADLGRHITGTPAAGAPGGARRRRSRARTRLVVGIPVAAALAVGGLIVTAIGGPGQRVGPVNVGAPPAQAAVMTVTKHGGYLDVIVKNPLADARKFRAEFAKYGLNISLTLVPASPSLVGTLVYSDGSAAIKPITAVGQCYTGGGGAACPVGVRVPLNFSGHADLTFGRAARPGERYETTAAANAPGELLHGLTYAGQSVRAVLAMLAARHVAVPHYLVSLNCENVGRATAPGDWYVTDADPYAPGAVQLWVSKSWPARLCASSGQPGPAPQPTATQH
jgi:hypothetical protein